LLITNFLIEEHECEGELVDDEGELAGLINSYFVSTFTWE